MEFLDFRPVVHIKSAGDGGHAFINFIRIQNYFYNYRIFAKVKHYVFIKFLNHFRYLCLIFYITTYPQVLFSNTLALQFLRAGAAPSQQYTCRQLIQIILCKVTIPAESSSFHFSFLQPLKFKILYNLLISVHPKTLDF